jgi:hypothetical protein
MLVQWSETEPAHWHINYANALRFLDKRAVRVTRNANKKTREPAK